MLVTNTMRETFQRDETQGRASVGTVITNRPPAFGDGERGQPTTRRFGCQIRVRSTRSCGTGITTAFVVTRAGNKEQRQENRARGDSEAGVHRHWQNIAEASLAVCASPRKGNTNNMPKKA